MKMKISKEIVKMFNKTQNVRKKVNKEHRDIQKISKRVDLHPFILLIAISYIV